MKSWVLALLVFGVVWFFGWNSLANPPSARVLIKVSKHTSLDAAQTLIKTWVESQRWEIVELRQLLNPATSEFVRFGLDRVLVLEVNGVQSTEAVRLIQKELANFVEYVEPDAVGFGGGFPNDPMFDVQWGLENRNDHDIDILDAWEITHGSSEVLIAVLDSGVNAEHVEFIGKVIMGSDFVNEDSDPTDDLGHGSNVAGIAAANTDNDEGIAGVCPLCKLLIVKVLDEENRGYYSWWIEGLNEAVQYQADVVNLSLGGTYDSPLLRNAIAATATSGAIIVACMMNTDSEAIYYPAAYPETIAVGATDRNDHRASPFSWGGGSNFGEHIDLVAPGNEILGPSYIEDAYAAWSGTSQATPHVSGTVGLMLSLDPSLTLEQVRQILHATAEDLVGDPTEDTPGFDIYYGYGRLNAGAALRALIEQEFEPEVEEVEFEEELEPETPQELEELTDGDIENPLADKDQEAIDTSEEFSSEPEAEPQPNPVWHFSGDRGCMYTQFSMSLVGFLLALMAVRGKTLFR